MIIFFAYSLVRKLVVSIASWPNLVRKLKIFLSAYYPLTTRRSFTFNSPIIFIFNALHTYQQASTYHLNIGLSKKQKQHLASIVIRSLESRKHRKIVDYKNQWKKEILKRQMVEKDYCDKYEDFSLDSSSEESNDNESGSD